jgi:beta-aspartyl-peptidase (threonine type)
VRSLETNPCFDAGVGSVLNEDGDVEMDAMIMDGKDLHLGAVAGASKVLHPITCARLIKDRTPHVLFVGDGADRVSEALGAEPAAQEDLVTPDARAEWEQYKRYRRTVEDLFDNNENTSDVTGHDTVGCVAHDRAGNVACGTSTGGITAKKAGRCGDSPLVGCGGYAANGWGAASATGHGESIARVVLSYRLVAAMGQLWHRAVGTWLPSWLGGGGATGAAERALQHMQTRVGGFGGIICVDGEGRVGMAHTTKRMAWARAEERDGGHVVSGIGL